MGSFRRDDKKSSGGFGHGFSGGNKSFSGGKRFGGGRPTMHQATCSECGASCELPFRPTGDRPVYCSNCFGKQDAGSSRPSKFSSDRRERPSFGSDRGDRQMHDAVCEKCGQDCQVPFRPTAGKPIYCSNCFDKSDRGSNRGGGQQSTVQLDVINAKLDMIMTALGLTGFKKEKKEEVVKPEVEKEVKIKKTVKVKKEKIKTKTTAKKAVAKKKK